MHQAITLCQPIIRMLALTVIVLAAPATARADGIFTPFAGVSFGGDQTERVATYGASLAGMAGGVFGFELDAAQTANAKTDTVFEANSKITTVNGNMIVGVPLGAVRPYVVGGVGLASDIDHQRGAERDQRRSRDCRRRRAHGLFLRPCRGSDRPPIHPCCDRR